MIKITYQKANGDIFDRVRNSYCSYKIGDITSMGWSVLDIQYKYKNKYYTKNQYDEKITRSINRYKKFLAIKKQVYTIYKNLVYCLVLLMSMRVYEIISNVKL